MITIRELRLDDETALKLMKIIKRHEPDIWKILSGELKQALNIPDVVGQSEQLPTRKELDEGWEKLRNSGLDKPLDKIE